MKKWILTVVAGCLFSGAAFSQSLTVEQYRKRVLAYNQEAKQVRETVKAALHALQAARTGFLPRLQVEGNYTYQFQEVEFMEGVNLKHENYTAAASLTQELYAGGNARYRRDAARLQASIARLGEEQTRDNLVYAADVHYWTAAANEQLFAVASEFVAIVQTLYALVDKRFEEGAISRTDVLMVKTRLQEAKLHRSSARMNRETAFKSLKIRIGLLPSDTLVVADSIAKPLFVPAPVALEGVLQRRADYRAAGEQVRLAGTVTRLTRAAYLPHLSVGVKEEWGTPLLNVDGRERFTTVAFAQLSVPLFHWGERRQLLLQDRARERTRFLEQSKVKDQIREELAEARIRLDETTRQVDIATATLAIARENLQLNTFSYNEGKLPILDVLSAQATWLQAYTSLVTAHYQHKLALAAYRKALGGH